MKTKKYKILIILTTLVIIITSIYLLLIKKEKNKTNDINHFKVFTIKEKNSDINSYIFYDIFNNNIYSINNFLYEDLYVVLSKTGENITDEIVDLAKENLKNNRKTFINNKKKYVTYTLKYALYNYIIDISWLNKSMPLIKEKDTKHFQKIAFEKYEDKNEYTLLYDVYSKIFIKDLKISSIIINNNETSLKTLEKEKYPADGIINAIFNLYPSKYTTNLSKETEIEKSLINIENDLTISVETKFENNNITYYISLNKK